MIAAGVPDPSDIRQRVARGRGLFISLDEAVTMPTATVTARALQVSTTREEFQMSLTAGRARV
ncbi:hypothetical protein [Micromonospora sp. LOL_015]|uniref:hypothetical protein n=1 Tax=Micromonospora sp. LOL_015 TaxID=3345416 RepID=UPI003A899B9B